MQCCIAVTTGMTDLPAKSLGVRESQRLHVFVRLVLEYQRARAMRPCHREVAELGKSSDQCPHLRQFQALQLRLENLQLSLGFLSPLLPKRRRWK